MKKVILLATLIFIGGAMANAQTKDNRQKPATPKEIEEWIDEKVDHMDDLLDLSDKQEDRIEGIYKKYFGKGQARTPERMKAMHVEIFKELTPAQQKKLESRREQYQKQCPHQGNKNCPHQGKGDCHAQGHHQMNRDCNHVGNRHCLN